jgi:hypothetical protein
VDATATPAPVPAAPPATVRRIAALALPALVVLGAEPLYVLVDIAVVGHLGRVPLANLTAQVVSAGLFVGRCWPSGSRCGRTRRCSRRSCPSAATWCCARCRCRPPSPRRRRWRPGSGRPR